MNVPCKSCEGVVGGLHNILSIGLLLTAALLAIFTALSIIVWK